MSEKVIRGAGLPPPPPPPATEMEAMSETDPPCCHQPIRSCASGTSGWGVNDESDQTVSDLVFHEPTFAAFTATTEPSRTSLVTSPKTESSMARPDVSAREKARTVISLPFLFVKVRAASAERTTPSLRRGWEGRGG